MAQLKWVVGFLQGFFVKGSIELFRVWGLGVVVTGVISRVPVVSNPH